MGCGTAGLFFEEIGLVSKDVGLFSKDILGSYRTPFTVTYEVGHAEWDVARLL